MGIALLKMKFEDINYLCLWLQIAFYESINASQLSKDSVNRFVKCN